MLQISIHGLELTISQLQALDRRIENLSPLLKEIGEDMVESTKQRFVSTTDPDGNQWKKNSQVTLDRKSGSRPLTNEGHLAASIDYQLLGGKSVEIGSPLDQAAMMQFGGKKAEFGQLWGDIPARPYLGLSAADERLVLDLVKDYLL